MAMAISTVVRLAPDTDTSAMASKMPGIAPAMNIRPTETPVNAPTMIIGTLGGIMGPTVDAAAVIAAAKDIG